ncbi:putative Endonuclease/exonuclease/phosphatase superfamily [Helianthus annuus]|nr:putative Endonuclease/exonuclease/phosphatase superfamily [Helianthus annuus]
MWVLSGDFNAVSCHTERRNSKFNVVVTNDFNKFILDNNLHEYGLKGRKFTCISGDKLSRIDRILVSWDLLNEWPLAEYRALSRDKSDHCPIILKTVSKSFGSKPFRFFNSWLERPNFVVLVKEALKGFKGVGDPNVVLMNKFKVLKRVIMDWVSKTRVKEMEELNTVKKEIEHLEEVLEVRDLGEDEHWIWEEAKKRRAELERLNNMDLRQKARGRWAKLGDENSRFFHGIINKRKVANYIPGLTVNGKWTTRPNLVKKEVLGFFRGKFMESMPCRPTYYAMA